MSYYLRLWYMKPNLLLPQSEAETQQRLLHVNSVGIFYSTFIKGCVPSQELCSEFPVRSGKRDLLKMMLF